METPPNSHYHIRWSGDKPLDWERFTTIEEAEASAAEMVHSGETYTIEKFGDDCVRCKETMTQVKQ